MNWKGRGIRVLKWTFVSVCILYVQLAAISRIVRNEEKPAHESGFKEHQHNENIMRVKLIHRYDHDSPFQKQGLTRLESLRSLLHKDKLRLTVFSMSKQRTGSHNAEPEGPVLFKKPDPAATIRAPIFSGSFVGAGEYFVELHIGTPPKRFLLIADTGSDLMWVNCRFGSKTRSRNSATRYFDAGISSTFSPVSCAAKLCLQVPAPSDARCSPRRPRSCKYMYSYSQGSSFTTGIYAYEALTINSSSTLTSKNVRIPRVAIGCSTRHKGDSFQGADGVIGLGQGSISFPSQIGHLYGDKFSYCLPSHVNGSSTTSNYLVFGHRSLDHLKSSLQYTPFLKNPPAVLDTFYYIGIDGVNINGKRLPIPRSSWLLDRLGNRGTIVDSGTTLTFFLQPGYGILLAAFERLVSYPRVSVDQFDLCFNSSGLANPRLPEFSINFAGGACFRPPVDNYFIDVLPEIKCLGIVGRSSQFDFNVIGNIMQQNFFVEFDRRKFRVGFARTDCSKH